MKRSAGKNACAKSAYNLRGAIQFEGNCIYGPKLYDWSSKEPPAFHEVLLPEGACQKFKDPETLWNVAEQKEKRYNSQVAIELLLALPDDQEISLDDRIWLARDFVQTHFVSKGLLAQIDIHTPEKEEHNWHAHVLITTRRCKKNGVELEDHKARDLMPKVCFGKVVEGPDWGYFWTLGQNAFFKAKGLSLIVDKNGVVPQEHLGPVRMRGQAFAIVCEHARLLEENRKQSQDPVHILSTLMKKEKTFTSRDVEAFLQKHVPFGLHDNLRRVLYEPLGSVQR
ncbi:MAG: MobA/MobL family protein [Rhabdochlamydiaceae bacterium]